MKSKLYFAAQSQDLALSKEDLEEGLRETVFSSNDCLHCEGTIAELVDNIEVRDIDERYPVNVFEFEIEYSFKIKQVGSVETGIRFIPDAVQPSTPIKKTRNTK